MIPPPEEKVLPSILIVDDFHFNVFSLQSILGQLFKLEADFAYSGKDAIQKIVERHSMFRENSPS